jgi:hypothetical protein
MLKHLTNFAPKRSPRGLSLWLACSAAILVLGCAQTPPSPTAAPDSAITPKAPSVAAPATPAAPKSEPQVASAPAPAPIEVPSASARSSADASAIATTSVLTPSGKGRYECVRGSSRSPIVLPDGSERICSRFPAMGPCQYVRDACRDSGGRVIRFDGTEITKDVENEYDRQVQRFRLNAG